MQIEMNLFQNKNTSFVSQINTLADRFGYDDIEPEDDVRSDFPCPYCYEDHDVTSLCAHLEDEHPFESKIVVSSDPSNCAILAGNSRLKASQIHTSGILFEM